MRRVWVVLLLVAACGWAEDAKLPSGAELVRVEMSSKTKWDSVVIVGHVVSGSPKLVVGDKVVFACLLKVAACGIPQPGIYMMMPTPETPRYHGPEYVLLSPNNVDGVEVEPSRYDVTLQMRSAAAK